MKLHYSDSEICEIISNLTQITCENIEQSIAAMTCTLEMSQYDIQNNRAQNLFRSLCNLCDRQDLIEDKTLLLCISNSQFHRNFNYSNWRNLDPKHGVFIKQDISNLCEVFFKKSKGFSIAIRQKKVYLKLFTTKVFSFVKIKFVSPTYYIFDCVFHNCKDPLLFSQIVDSQSMKFEISYSQFFQGVRISNLTLSQLNKILNKLKRNNVNIFEKQYLVSIDYVPVISWWNESTSRVVVFKDHSNSRKKIHNRRI